LYINEKDFHLIFHQLFNKGKPHCDELFVVARQFLETTMTKYWAAQITPRPTFHDLEDALQEVCWDIARDAKQKFFLAKDESGAYKYPMRVGVFCSWMRTKGYRKFITFFKDSKKNQDYVIISVDESGLVDIPAPDDYLSDDEFNERGSVRAAVDKLLNSKKTSVYLKLTLLALNVCAVSEGIYDAEKNHYIADRFSKMTLFDMLRNLVKASDDIEWLKLSKEQLDMFISALREKYDDERLYAQVRYEELFNEGTEAHISISKTISRISSRIEAQLFPVVDVDEE